MIKSKEKEPHYVIIDPQVRRLEIITECYLQGTRYTIIVIGMVGSLIFFLASTLGIENWLIYLLTALEIYLILGMTEKFRTRRFYKTLLEDIKKVG